MLAVAAAVASALALGVVRGIQGNPLGGVLRGLLVLLLAAAFAVWTGHARDFFLPGMYVDAAYAVALAVSAGVGRPLVGYVYTALFRAGGHWRRDVRLRRVLSIATLGWAATYALRASVQLALYRADEPGLLAMAKLALGWPLTAVAVVLTLRSIRTARAGVTGARDLAERAGCAAGCAAVAVPGTAGRQPPESGSRHLVMQVELVDLVKAKEPRDVRTSGTGEAG